MKLLLGLGFIFIVPVTKLVARSPLTSQVYMNIDFKRGEYNIFLRILILPRPDFLSRGLFHPAHIHDMRYKKIIKMH